jgi:hypothetical protein
VERTRTAVERARELRASLLAHLLSHGIGPDGKAQGAAMAAGHLVSTTLGKLPANWHLSSVYHEFEIQTGFTLNPHRRARFKGRPYLRVANVQRDVLNLSDVQELDPTSTVSA